MNLSTLPHASQISLVAATTVSLSILAGALLGPRIYRTIILVQLCILLFLTSTVLAQDGAPQSVDPDDLTQALRTLNSLAQPDDSIPVPASETEPVQYEAPAALSALAEPRAADTPTPATPDNADPSPPARPAPPPVPETTVPPAPSAEPTPSPAAPQFPEPAPAAGFEPGPAFGLPLSADARIRIANDHALLTLAGSLIATMSEIQENGHGPALLSLIAASRPGDNETYTLFSNILSSINASQSATAQTLAAEMYQQYLEDEAGRQTPVRPAPAPAVDPATITIAPVVASPQPAPPALPVDVDIVPITAQVATDTGQTEKAIIAINGRREILWPGDTVNDPNGDPVTLLRIETEGPENNPVYRVVINHAGATRRLAWIWE